MARFVLIYKNRHPPPEDLERIHGVPGLQVLDASQSHLMLVEADEASLREVTGAMPGWTMSAEQRLQLE